MDRPAGKHNKKNLKIQMTICINESTSERKRPARTEKCIPDTPENKEQC